jgi:hypothetical protein
MREFGDSHKRGALHMNKIRGSTHWGEDIERKPTCAAVDEVSPPRSRSCSSACRAARSSWTRAGKVADFGIQKPRTGLA